MKHTQKRSMKYAYRNTKEKFLYGTNISKNPFRTNDSETIMMEYLAFFSADHEAREIEVLS